MAFGARQADDRTWRLCHRKGRTILHWNRHNWPDAEIIFSSQAKAKACADALNERWKDYERAELRSRGEPSQDLINWMFQTIVDHGGLTDATAAKICSPVS